MALAKLAGVPVDDATNIWQLNEGELDSQAKAKGWTKLDCKQPAMARYRKDDSRINFYLSTGTLGSCIDHPKQGK
ncbi:hypothetical protein ACHAWF_002188, partial [Thalassiosira exigua]